MEVELTTPRSGPAGAYSRGDKIEIPDAEAKRLIEAGKARPVASKSGRGKRSKATVQADEERDDA